MAQASARRRWLRYAAWTTAAGIAAGVALAVVVATRFQSEDLARLLSANVKARTGRDLVIEGPVGYSVSLVPLLYAENVRLQNAPWGSRPDMLTAKRAYMSLSCAIEARAGRGTMLPADHQQAVHVGPLVERRVAANGSAGEWRARV